MTGDKIAGDKKRIFLWGIQVSVTFLFILGALLLIISPVHAGGHREEIESNKELILFRDIQSVFGASKYEQKTTEAPSSVTIITAEEIERYGCRTLADVLESVRGLYTTYDRNYSFLGVRGFLPPGDTISRILLLVNGSPQNDASYDGMVIDTSNGLDVNMIKR
ncbi:MAG: TonB-dependent receptor plug domain-containing protein, partial [bacterium]|nr:TonB-dependent receptor plug domain-containing protein [bacterium]